jgi:CheY-like chemotaxis protein
MIGSASGLRPVEFSLVEDSASDIFIIKETLRELPFPINVRVAVDGQQALKMFADDNFRPDLVILDLNLPIGSRIRCVEELQHTGNSNCCFQFLIESRGHAALIRVGR